MAIDIQKVGYFYTLFEKDIHLGAIIAPKKV